MEICEVRNALRLRRDHMNPQTKKIPEKSLWCECDHKTEASKQKEKSRKYFNFYDWNCKKFLQLHSKVATL